MAVRIGHGPALSHCAWPESVTSMQGRDVSLGRTRAFVEVAIHEGAVNTFIRAESTVSLRHAEAKAFGRYLAYRSCRGHDFEHGVWRNGSGVCQHCRMWSPDVLEPLERCVECSAPTYYSSYGKRFWCEKHESSRPRHQWEIDMDAESEVDYDSAEFAQALSDVLTAVAKAGDK